MKNYKKGLLTLTVLVTMSLMAAGEDYTIYVNTFADEDGENESQCSLREAITAASLHQAYGGCPKGQQHHTITNIIQLEAGEYKLNKELITPIDSHDFLILMQNINYIQDEIYHTLSLLDIYYFIVEIHYRYFILNFI